MSPHQSSGQTFGQPSLELGVALRHSPRSLTVSFRGLGSNHRQSLHDESFALGAPRIFSKVLSSPFKSPGHRLIGIIPRSRSNFYRAQLCHALLPLSGCPAFGYFLGPYVAAYSLARSRIFSSPRLMQKPRSVREKYSPTHSSHIYQSDI